MVGGNDVSAKPGVISGFTLRPRAGYNFYGTNVQEIVGNVKFRMSACAKH
jgi:hypothetical protein